MTQPTESAILDALGAYRAHIAEANRRAMLVIIPQIEAADMEDDDLFESPEEEEGARLEFVHNLVGVPEGNTQPPIERASDVLDKWDLIVQQLALDGASVNADAEWRAEKREAYRSAILEGLGRISCPDGEWALPSDFEILMQYVDNLEGPGWRRLRDMTERLIFWEGWRPDGISEDREWIQRRVMSGQAIMDEAFDLHGYEVAGGWVCGKGNESRCYVVYSRPVRDKTQDWSWRYVASMGQFGSKMFDDIVAVLDWYSHHAEPDEGEFKVTAEEVFQP